MKIDSLKIKTIMLQKGLNNTTLSKSMKSTRQWLGVVLERESATKEYIAKIAQALDVDPKEIVKLED